MIHFLMYTKSTKECQPECDEKTVQFQTIEEPLIFKAPAGRNKSKAPDETCLGIRQGWGMSVSALRIYEKHEGWRAAELDKLLCFLRFLLGGYGERMVPVKQETNWLTVVKSFHYFPTRKILPSYR